MEMLKQHNAQLEAVLAKSATGNPYVKPSANPAKICMSIWPGILSTPISMYTHTRPASHQ